MSDNFLPCVAIDPSIKPQAVIIWLHGLGADGHDFAQAVPQLNLPPELGIRFVFPHAPVRPITLNNGYQMRAWYDITGLTLCSREDELGIISSEQTIVALIDREIANGIPSNKIILAGFSQGGALALHTGLRYSKPLAGILALSTYLPLAKKLSTEKHTANYNIPIFLAHGENDPVIPLSWAQMAHQQLQHLNYAPQWQAYPMEHSVSQQEMHDIRQWIIKVCE